MNIETFILIGGRSARFGKDKAFAKFGQRTFAEHAAATVNEALPGTNITFVASSDSQFDGSLVLSLGRPVVSDLKPGFGAWSGFHTAISYARADYALVLACDLPFVTEELLGLLVNNVSDGVEAVVPRQPDGRLQPLCAIYRSSRLRNALESFQFGRDILPSLASFVEGLGSRIVETRETAPLAGSDRFFANINTPDELAAVREECSK